MTRAQINRIGIFYGMACGFSWGLFALSSSFTVLAQSLIYMMGPLLAVIVCMWSFRQKEWRAILALRPSAWPYYGIGWGAMVLLAALALWLTLWSGAGGYVGLSDGLKLLTLADSGAEGKIPPVPVVLLLGIVVGPVLYMLPVLMEELGWRGWLWHETRTLGFWRASFLNGLLWGLWQGPLIYFGSQYLGTGFAGVLMMVLLSVMSAPLLCFMRQASGSVLVPAVMHATLNAVVPLSLVVVTGAHPLAQGYLGWPGVMVLGLALVVIYYWLERRDLPDH